MFARPLHHRCAAWLALLAVLWGALVPTLAQAVVSGADRQGWVEVCSASGVLWVQVDGGAKSPNGEREPMADASAHCPWCPFQGAAGLPTEAVQGTPASTRGSVPGVAFVSARPGAVWSPAQSRAPPAV